MPLRALVRLGAFCALAAFGALHWAALVEPAEPLRALAPVGLVALGAPVALAIFRRGWGRARQVAALSGLAAAQAVGAAVAAGIPLRLLVPDAWGDLAAGVEQGLAALPGLSVPYRGADEWVHAVLMLGGGCIVLIAGWLTFLRGAGRRVGPPVAAATQLVALYVVPIVENGPQLPFLGGAALALLLVAFLWGERLAVRDLRLAAVLAVGATLLALLVAPRIDAQRPLLDYERLAERLEARGSTEFQWDHGYGPLDWPRDGREVLRVRARDAAYWKAASLESFDGVRWRSRPPSGIFERDSEFTGGRPAWHQTIRVVVRNMRSHEYVGAGTTRTIIDPPRGLVPATPGTHRTAADDPLQPGDAYRAQVYVPRPSAARLREAGTEYPTFLAGNLDLVLPESVGGPLQDRRPGQPTPPGQRGPGIGPPAVVRIAPFGQGRLVLGRSPRGFPSDSGALWLRASRYGRAYALASSLAREADTPYDFLRAVQRQVSSGATYSEQPSRHALPLDAFLFDDRVGYCQQFSGAMALLLRLGGVPARVASGFTAGSLDRSRGEYVVRDIDAHSWVEAYFPRYGWVPFDPTPAIAPPRAQAIAEQSASAATPDLGDLGGAAQPGGDRPEPGTGAGGGGDGWRRPLIAGLVALGLVLAVAVAVRRRRRSSVPPGGPELAELVRALRRTGRVPEPRVTLRDLELVLDTAEGGTGYLRALREQRFAGRPGGPTAGERRALRRSLAAGLGVGGRLRAWWALPPRLGRGRSSYTA